MNHPTLSHPASPTLGTEAIRAMITLRSCWQENEEIYLNRGCLHCGAAATYLIYFTSRKIQQLMLDFIAQFPCSQQILFDHTDVQGFGEAYEHFLQQLEQQIIHYAFSQTLQKRAQPFEHIESIFERPALQLCRSA